MPGRLEVLAFLQVSAAKMRRLAHDRPSTVSSELIRLADEIAIEAAKLEAELIGAGLVVPPAANQN